MIKLSEFVNDYHIITEKILINKNTKIDKNNYILEWPNVYNLLCSCQFSSYIINDFKNSTNDAGDVYFGCVKSKTNNADIINLVTSLSLFNKYHSKMKLLGPNVSNNSIKTLQKNNPKIFDSKTSIRLWSYYYNHDDIYFILYLIYTNNEWYVIILANSELMLDDFYKLFQYDNAKNDNQWTRYDDLKIC